MLLRRRYFRILFFFLGAMLQMIWWDIILVRVIGRRLVKRGQMKRLGDIAARFRVLAISMGGVMIKVGQFLSARMDVLPAAVTDELSGLQDEVHAEEFAAIRKVVEEEFGAALENKFADFNPVPLASASIGQVHLARLRLTDGLVVPDAASVVVKVQRPNIEVIVSTDLSALRVVGRWMNAYSVIRKRANIPALLEEFSRTLYEEMDYLHEGKNAEMFSANFAQNPSICVPQVHWSHTTRRVLTLENIPAIKITDYSAIEAAGIDRVDVANRLFDTYLKQVFEDGFFHADPHPGNLFVIPETWQDGAAAGSWKMVFVDFGMAGVISPELMESLRELMIGIGTRDSMRIIRTYQSMEILLPGADLELLERASGRVFERFWGKSTQDMLNFSRDEAMEFVHEFGTLLYDMPFQVPENLILLARALAILMGICSGLDPSFNVWALGVPYAQRLVASERGNGLQPWLKEAGSNLVSAVLLPGKLDRLIGRIEQGRVETRNPRLEESLRKIERGQRRLIAAVFFGGLLTSATLLFLGDVILPAEILGALALLVLLSTLR